MIDRQQLHEFIKYYGKDILIEISDMLISEYDERFRNLKANVAARNYKDLQFNAHSLKGVIANFMDPVTIEQSKRLDQLAKTAIEHWEKSDETTRKEIEAGIEKALIDIEKSSALLIEELKKIKKEIT